MAQPAPMAAPSAVDALPRRRVGILALQGDVREHAVAIREIGAEPIPVRLPRDLVDLDALILPGGESTTMRNLIDRYGLREPIRAFAHGGAPIFGTCAGMILLAARIADGDEPVLGLLDVTVQRNAYGRQLDSFEADLAMPALGTEPLHGVFIRAPIVSDLGDGVEALARDADERPIAVRQGRILATAFHPELTSDRRVHRLLLEMIGA
jgi:5'-phosphate synthase pdxT subunit